MSLGSRLALVVALALGCTQAPASVVPDGVLRISTGWGLLPVYAKP